MPNSRSRFQALFAATAASLAIVLAGCGETPTAVPHHLTSKHTAAAPVAAAKASTAVAKAPAAKPAAPAEAAPAQEPAKAVATSSTDALPTDDANATAKAIAVEMTAGGNSSASSDTTGSLPVVADSHLTAEITAQKNGVFLGMGSYKCTVQVSNDSDQERTGILKVTFMNGEKESKTAPSVQLVTIPAHGSQSFDFADKKWSTDNAVVEVAETAHGQAMAAFVTMKKNGVFLGMGTYKCTVEVINPDDEPHTGTLIVTFKHGSKDSATPPATQVVTLQPHTAQTFDFSDKKWSTNDVVATIE